MDARGYNAFTLLELLAVLGIVTLVAGSAGLAMRDGSPGVALTAGQETVASLLAAARSAAMMNQSRAMLIVNADPGGERFLRGLDVVVETAPLSNRWCTTGPAGLLPRGVYVVPSRDESTGVVFAPLHDDPPTWPAGRRSTLAALPQGSVVLLPGHVAARYCGMVDPLSASGACQGGKIVLAGARRTAEAVVFEQVTWVRGIAISRYGAAILVGERSGFDF